MRKPFDPEKVNPNRVELETLNPYVVEPQEVQPGDQFGWKVVCRVYDGKFWCAFRGPTTWTDSHVAEYGTEVDFSVARILFPSIANVIPVYKNL